MTVATQTAPHPSAASAASETQRPGRLSRDDYLRGILDGDRRVLARAITLIESSRPRDRELAEQIVEDCLPHSGQALRIGVTGVPGAGKSSLIEALGRWLIAQPGQNLAVLAIDPSSQLSGGSILGDKTRMNLLSQNERAFIRPSPARDAFGGVAQHTREAILLCEAAGYRNIFVETVGVGQAETAVRDMVDFFLLVALAGVGDELQGIKRGAMELADLVTINKADDPNLVAAERARADAENALRFFPRSQSGWTPRALACSALTGAGVPELWTCIQEHAALTAANGWRSLARREQARRWMHELVEQELRRRFAAHPSVRSRLTTLEQDVLEGRTPAFRAARTLLEIYSGGK